ncbi:MAG: prephenate dehydratase [Gammaproteobacteria bacterium]|nr:prephenate dehydratase [Gammaproteobacteria bacterium]
MSEDKKPLDAVRENIDKIDRELQRLLNERAACAYKVAEIKQSEPGEEPPVFYRPEREAQILTRLMQENEGPLSDDDIARLFREIISCCLNLEQPLTISYLGPPGTYTEMAVIKQFGHFARPRSRASIDEVFREVESESTHYGVVPIENSTEGMVNHTLDCFMDSPLQICSEIELPIHHAFMVSTQWKDEPITEVVSHAQSLAQCRSWLDTNHAGIPRVAVNSNAEAARLVAEKQGSAAIAGEVAAERYGLRVLAKQIEDHPDNKTRFLVIGRQKTGPSGRDKTSILVSTKNAPGALYKVLEPFHRHEISLTRIETRPAKSGDWSYVFFIDFDGHQSEPKIKAVLEEVAKVALEVRSLGSYPQAVV